MKVDLFSERQRLARSAGQADVYQYDDVPKSLRVQIGQIAIDALGSATFNGGKYHPTAASAWRYVRCVLCREYGCHSLTGKNELSDDDEVLQFIEKTDESFKVLDATELICKIIAKRDKLYQSTYTRSGELISSSNAIDELNLRFRRAGVGYQFAEDSMLRIDSQLLHAEVVLPALSLLSSPAMAGPNEEFRDAHKHYRHGEFDDAILTCGKSFESFLKVVHDHMNWPYAPKAGASDLLGGVFKNKLIPEATDGSMNALRTCLESTVPPLRNRMGGHGQGSVPRTVPAHIASFVIHSTASAMLLISQAAGIK